MIHFYHTFAEARTFEIGYSAFCFVAWGTVLVEISQIREKLWEVIVFVEIFCVAGTQSALLLLLFCSYFSHLWKLRNVSIFRVCALSLSLSLVFISLLIYLCLRPSKHFAPVLRVLL